MANALGIPDAQYEAIIAGARSARNDLATTGKIQPVPSTPSMPGSTVKTADQYVPYISANPSPNGGNTTEYRAPRAGDTGIGVTPPTTPTAAPQTIAQPVSAQQSYQPPDYAALAAARTALALQQKQTIANQQKQSAQSAYDQQNLRTKDDRVLGDFSRTQTANPFGNMGRTSFQEGLIGRERTQQDADASAALATQKGNIDQMLADYQNATADEQVRIADELKRADQQYQLQLSAQTGTMADGTRNLAGQQYDWNTSPNNPQNQGQVLQNQGQAQQNLLNQYKIDDYPAEQKANATKVQQELAAGKMTLETAEYNLKQLKDPNSPKNQADKIDLQLKQLDLKNAPEKARLEVQQLQKQIAEIGKVHYKPQTETEIEMDKVTLQTAQEKLKQLQNPTADPKKATDYKTNPEFATDIAYIKANPSSASMLDSNAEQFIASYGYDGYKALREAAGLD